MAFFPDYTPPPRIQIWTPQPAPTQGPVEIPPAVASGPAIVGRQWNANGNDTIYEPLALSPNIVPQFIQYVNGTTAEIRGAAFESQVDLYQRFLILDMNLVSLGFEQQ